LFIFSEAIEAEQQSAHVLATPDEVVEAFRPFALVTVIEPEMAGLLPVFSRRTISQLLDFVKPK
jgi:hypothetical protein